MGDRRITTIIYRSAPVIANRTLIVFYEDGEAELERGLTPAQAYDRAKGAGLADKFVPSANQVTIWHEDPDDWQVAHPPDSN